MTFSVQGAWTRQSVTVDGCAPFETQRVYWLQAGPCYADIRVPFYPGSTFRCFGGRSQWDGDGDGFRWTHRLDLEDANPEDVGHFVWEDGRLVERGWFGHRRYEEVWVRIDDDTGPFLAAEDPDACLVRVGDHAITVVDARLQSPDGEFAACYRVLTPVGWEIRAAIGEGAATLPGPSDIPAQWRPVAVHA